MGDCIIDPLDKLVRHDGRTEDGSDLMLVACSMAFDVGVDLPPTICHLLRAQADPNAVDLRLRGPFHNLLANLNSADHDRINPLGNLLVEKRTPANAYMVDEERRAVVADIWICVRNQGSSR